MNKNSIITESWSNPKSEELYRGDFSDNPEAASLYHEGSQCGGCSFFAPFNADFGLCCNPTSPHNLETVFEHFTCTKYESEGWGPHSFTDNKAHHCRCGGESSEYWDRMAKLFEKDPGIQAGK
jgi:hypothetical protein